MCYVGYCVVLYFDQQLKNLFQQRIFRLPIHFPEQMTFVVLKSSSNKTEISTIESSSPQLEPGDAKIAASDRETMNWDPNSAWKTNETQTSPAVTTIDPDSIESENASFLKTMHQYIVHPVRCCCSWTVRPRIYCRIKPLISFFVDSGCKEGKIQGLVHFVIFDVVSEGRSYFENKPLLL